MNQTSETGRCSAPFHNLTTSSLPYNFGLTAPLLQNPVYLGAIRHRDKLYAEAHPAIIAQSLWDEVQARLKNNGCEHPDTPKLADPILLKGLVVDAEGRPMTLTHTARRGKRYRYYVGSKGAGPASRIAVGTLDDFVTSEVAQRLRPDFLQGAGARLRIQTALLKVCVMAEAVQLRLRCDAVSNKIADLPGRLNVLDNEIELTIPIIMKHRQGALLIEGPDTSSLAGRIDRALVRAVALARSWAARLDSGAATSLKTLALSEGYCEHYAARLLPLAWLAPDLVEIILEGQQPRALSLGALIRNPLPIEWSEQRAFVAGLGRLSAA